MRARRGLSTGLRATAVSLLALSLLLSGSPLYHRAEATSSASGFSVASAVWGTPAAPMEAAPGNNNVPLTITLQYYYYNTAQGITVTLDLPPGFTDTNGNSITTAYVSGQQPSGAVVSVTLNLDIASNVRLGSWAFPMTITWGAITNFSPLQSVSEVQSTSATVALRGKVQLQFSAGEPTLSPGTVNDVPIVVSNTGTGNATSVTLDVAASSSLLSSASVSVLNTPPQIASISENSSTVTYVSVYAPQSLAGSPISLSITGTYSDAYGNTRAISSSVGIYVQTTASAPITVTPLSLQLTPGAVNNVTLLLSNSGRESLTQLQVSVAVPPSVSLLRQFPVTVRGLEEGANETVSMPIFVSASLSGSPVTIPTTVTYTDTAGGTGSLTQNLGFYVPVATSPSIGLSGYAYSPALIYPGMTVATLQVTIYNSGTTPATNVNATLLPSSPVYSLSGRSLSQSAGLLPVGQSFPFTYTVGILNSSQPINSTLTLLLRSSGSGPAQYAIPFVEQPKAHFKVLSVSAPTVSSGDGADQITVTLQNTGKAAAQMATFTMQPSYVFEPSTQGSFTTTPSTGIGTVPAGGVANLTVVVQVNSNLKPDLYQLVFHASWAQLGSSQPFVQDISLMVPVRASVFQTANSVLFSWPFLLVVVAVLAALFLRRSRSRTRRKATPDSG